MRNDNVYKEIVHFTTSHLKMVLTFDLIYEQVLMLIEKLSKVVFVFKITSHDTSILNSCFSR